LAALSQLRGLLLNGPALVAYELPGWVVPMNMLFLANPQYPSMIEE